MDEIGRAYSENPALSWPARYLIVTVALLFSACGGSGGGSSSGSSKERATESTSIVTEQARTNILLIMADDLGVNDLGINNEARATDTPNLDAFAREGVSFARHYADSVCNPARAALLTGQQPARNGYATNRRGLSPQLTTLPEALQAHGYTTWHIGKWHLGDEYRAAWPDAQGFDHWFGFLNQWLLSGDPGNSETVSVGPRYHRPWLIEDADGGQYYDGHLEDVLTAKTLDVLASLQNAKAPWFINLWFYAPHAPLQPAAQFAEQYPDNPAGHYRALVNQLDYNIGRILDYLDVSGQSENTMVVVVSDNGGTSREVDSNSPYYGSKGSFYEGGVRTPLLVRWPDGKQGGSVYDGQITLYDLFPSLMASLDLPIPPGLDGVDVFSHVEQGTTVARDLFWEMAFAYAVRSADQRWLLLKDHWRGEDGPLFLADLDNDQAGAVDVRDAFPEQAEELRRRHKQWHRKIHRVKVDKSLDQLGHGQLSGLDFMRTPGFGDFTLGIGFEPAYQGPLARQAEVWSLSIDGSRMVRLDFQDIQLTARLPDDGACHSVIASARFSPPIPGIRNVKENFSVALYVDGERTAALEGQGGLDDSNYQAPTLIGEPGGSEPDARLSSPILLNVFLPKSYGWSGDRMHKHLCSK